MSHAIVSATTDPKNIYERIILLNTFGDSLVYELCTCLTPTAQ